MGVNKKFLLLAVIILGMQTESYATIWTKATDVNVTQEEINKHITASNSKAQVIAIQSGGTATINKDVTVDITKIKDDKDHLYSKFINVASGSKDKISVNNGNITIKNESGNQFEVVSMQSGTFQNAGNISISGAKGIGFNITGAAKAENTGTFNIDNKAVGVNISHANAEFINGEEGKITVTGGTGILQTAGTVTNAGSINVSAGATGLDLQGGTFINNGKINLSGETAKLDIKGGNFKNTNEIKINVTKSGAAGIVQSGGKIENSGSINVQEGKGFYIKDGEIENTGIINVNSNEQGEIKNTNTVTGIQLQGVNATFKNEGQINVLSTTTIINDKEEIKSGVGVAVSEEVKDENGEIISSFINNGIIDVKTNSKGLQITKGKAENQGIIRVEKKKLLEFI